MEQTKRITFFGFSEAAAEDEDYKNAYQTAALLAKEGFVIVDGAGPGVMRAATEGAKSVGGKTIGVSFNPKGMTNFEGRDPGNLVDREIVAPDYFERTMKLIELGDALVFFNGGTGTISEFGMAWGLARLFFGKHKPLILFGSWWHEIMEAFGKNMHLRDQEIRVYRIVNTPEETVEEIIKTIGRPKMLA
ncbi:MAG: LOG family protein [Patescibacteria group bacterium]|nr:LOG family protein [Patescibacteria group bacterium]